MFNLVVLIDLKKAFDTVDHQILLRELELYGMKGQGGTIFSQFISLKSKSEMPNKWIFVIGESD
jgi:hypothetical protein